MKEKFSPGEAQEILECLQALIDSAGYDHDAYWKLRKLTDPRILEGTPSFARDYVGISIEDARGNSRLRIILDLVRNGSCYLEGLKKGSERCQKNDLTDARTGEDFVRRAEAFVSRAVLIIRSDLKSLKKRERKMKGMDDYTEKSLADKLPPIELFDEALAKLSDPERRVIKGIYQESKKGVELAEEMKVTPARISQLHHKALAILADTLKDFKE
jgi:RNA polymerase sigma factor (sigma-70 family)